ncbi:hypothetical protein MAFF301069_32420 [Ralstonia pseudosolanacearum]|nr:hypothetical protein CJO84_16330 [Ralstonia solanacearum]BEU68687.1 hypothetical protein MAFF301069_32420 [Ralstonia pseudosolanacearum]
MRVDLPKGRLEIDKRSSGFIQFKPGQEIGEPAQPNRFAKKDEKSGMICAKQQPQLVFLQSLSLYQQR